MKKLLLVFFVLWINAPCIAQTQLNTTSKAALKNYRIANSYLDQNNIRLAIIELNEATENDPNFIEAFLLLGDAYRSVINYDDAFIAYQKAYAINPNYAPERTFFYAEAALKTGKYALAKTLFIKYLDNVTVSSNNIAKAKKYIKDCDFSQVAIKNPVKFKPVNMGAAVNSVHDEYMAAVTADESKLIFTRQIDFKEDFYQSDKINNTWNEAQFLSPVLSTADYNEGAQCISPDGQYLFFTGCNRPDGFGRCDIFISKKDGNNWLVPKNLGFPINTRNWESQPSISADGRTIYFVSDRKGGFGGYDIWESELDSTGSWGIPTNLGPTINTPYDDMTPFIHPDNKTLYFSSDGWIGLGSKDIFLSRLSENNKWGLPENLGYPINTFNDEAGLIINPSGDTAYFSSNQFAGFGGLDLYHFDIEAKKIKPIYTNYVKGKVYDAKTKLPLEAEIQILDLKTGDILLHSYANKMDGSFLDILPQGTEFALIASANGYLFFSESFEPTYHKLNEPVELDIPLQMIEVGKNVVLKNIYFENNKYNLKPQSKAELQKLFVFLGLNPTVKIDIEGFTDNIGNNEQNQLLSENRSKSVYQYLINNGIKPNRLHYRGFGASKPIADNSTELGKASNRRTEIVIKGK
ncbi:MAG: hypothetical protein EAZ51_03385 [Sphingobacteriales bacterium]|nr:MAG: hypothetical protein EAZ64_04775 [Sphingobacteriales bacterium]TAF81876.1 MAG: hypothetical protein EAZ51_03385 [Sphingobacteriales bacterium]